MIDKILEAYERLTGRTLSPEQRAVYVPYAMRAVRMLESRLGWALDNPPEAEVAGMTKNGCDCSSAMNIEDAPDAMGKYRYFPLDTRKPNIHIDPFKKVHNVYLCRVQSASDELGTVGGEAIILAKITNFTPIYFGTFGKYVKACREMTACQQTCNSNCTNCASILVDADWMGIDDLPDELLFLICDYIDWVANDGLATRAIKSESVDGHSVSYGSWITTAPYNHSNDTAIIKLYTGPYGAVNRKLIW